MAASQTTRLSIYTWSAGTDTFTRDQMTTSHSNLETKVAGYNQAGSRPSAAAAYSGFFHYSSTDSTVGTLSYCNGNSWFTIGALSAGTPTPLDGSAAVGSAVDASRSDHKHAIANDAITNAMIDENAVQALQINADAVTTIKILAKNVTHEKIEDSAALSVIGRSANSPGVVADIAAGADHYVLRRSGTSIGFGEINTDGIADNAITIGKMATDSVGTDEIAEGAVGISELATGAVTTIKIANDNVTHEKMEESAALSVLGVSGSSAAHVADIVAGSDFYVLRRHGSAVGFGAVQTGGIATDAVTSAKLNSTSGAEAVTSDVIRDNAVGDDALNYANISVYGKNGSAPAGHRIYASSSAPSGSGFAAGDIWLEHA